MNIYPVLRKALHALPPETAHQLTITALKHGMIPPAKAVKHEKLVVDCLGLQFPNPVGLAAGFDKNAESADGLLKQGFGFVELGTVTPLPQPGNAKPRIFRLPEDDAVINRYGFNSEGLHIFVGNLAKRKEKGIVGANIGKNRDSMDAAHDYARGLEAVYPFVDYITINISSPNTVGLRDLQQKNALAELAASIENMRKIMIEKTGKRIPLLYKIAPDISEALRHDIVKTVFDYQIDGLILTNTTLERPDSLQNLHKEEKGGLSGKPLFERSTRVLSDIYRISEGKIPLIGVGGIASAEDAYRKIKAGASLIQLYTALIYQGTQLVQDINNGLLALMERDGIKAVQALTGSDHKKSHSPAHHTS